MNEQLSSMPDRSQEAYDELINSHKRRRNIFALSGSISIPAGIFLSYASSAKIIATPWIDILFLGSMLIPAVTTYQFVSKLLPKRKALLYSIGMFFPTILIQVTILIGLWIGFNRGIAAAAKSRSALTQ